MCNYQISGANINHSHRLRSPHKSHRTVTFERSQNYEAPQARLCGNPPTIGKILKFKKAISNTNMHTGILDYTRDGD
jgi:hypothetical protein